MSVLSLSGGKLSGSMVLFLAIGCGANELKRVPVAGAIVNENQPLPGGIVTFAPDASKGNKTQVVSSGTIQSDGSFQLKAGDDKRGVPVGWYKVMVQVEGPGIPRPAGKSIRINPKYSDPKKTDLEVEVAENPAPDLYTFKLRK